MEGSRMTWRERIALAVLVVGMGISLVWLVHGWYDPTNDGAMYILTARSILAGEGYSMLGEAFRIRPPAFSLMIAPILALRGTDFYAINLLVSAFGILGCALLFLFARPRVGWVVAWLVAVAVWLNPGYQLLCNQAMSDVPGTALLVACLLLERKLRKRRTWRTDLGLGAFIALTAYMRSINVLVVPAIVGVRLLDRLLPRRASDDVSAGEPDAREGWGRFALGVAALALGAYAVQLPWDVRNARNAPEPPVDQVLLYSYSTGMWHEDMGDPNSPRLSIGDILGRFPERGGLAMDALGSRLMETDTPTPSFAFVLLGCVLYVLVKRREPAELFVLGAMALISVYFGFAVRLLLPIYMLALPCAAELVLDLARVSVGRLAPQRWSSVVASTVAALAVGALVWYDFEPRRDWDKIENGHLKLHFVCAGFEARLSDDAVIATNRPWHYAVLLERPVYAFEFVYRRYDEPGLDERKHAEIEKVIDKYGINTVVLSPIRNKDLELLPYFDARYGPKTDPAARVYRVR